MNAKTFLMASGLVLWTRSGLMADLGLLDSPVAAQPIRLSAAAPGEELAVCFTCASDMEARGLALLCEQAVEAPAYLLALHEEKGGKPGPVLAESASAHPQAGAWLNGALDGAALQQGRRYCLSLRPDWLRGGRHAADRPKPGRWSAWQAMAGLGTGTKAWRGSGGKWAALDAAPLWALSGRGRRIQGSAWEAALALPVHGGGTPTDPHDDRWQAQVFHFPCGHQPTHVRARVRKIGSPSKPLRWAMLKHDYMAHKTMPLSEGTLAEASQVGPDWAWVEAPLDPKLGSLPPECHYLALKSAAGAPEGAGCRDCYEVSGARVARGLALTQELSWYGGAHKDRASSSLNGGHWTDDFEADLNVVVAGPPCQAQDLGADPRLLPTPVPWMEPWPR